MVTDALLADALKSPPPHTLLNTRTLAPHPASVPLHALQEARSTPRTPEKSERGDRG